MGEKTFVTRPFMPPIEEFEPYLKEIWESHCLTNGGKFHEQLEKELANFLGVKHICLFANGTLALLTAMQALKLTGEVITTPFSFVATSHSLLWNGLKPVFVDITKDTFSINPDKIEEAITPDTTAILPVHVYGIPCDTVKIQNIADTYGLKVIYDAAHAFGVDCRGESILNCGDLSVLSFHATKVFNTFEGGAIICHDEKTKNRIDKLKNFGHDGETKVIALGINGKMNEVQSAFGLLQLKYVRTLINKRKAIYEKYKEKLSKIDGIIVPELPKGLVHNYSYFPILVGDEYPQTRDGLNDTLRCQNIYARRYFYPLISDFATYRRMPSASPDNLPVARKVAGQILCLPIYPDLQDETIERVIELIKNS